jgi:hypothetical protein
MTERCNIFLHSGLIPNIAPKSTISGIRTPVPGGEAVDAAFDLSELHEVYLAASLDSGQSLNPLDFACDSAVADMSGGNKAVVESNMITSNLTIVIEFLFGHSPMVTANSPALTDLSLGFYLNSTVAILWED